MKKSELIKALNNIEGDPEIKLWNGFVGDYQDLSEDLVSTFLMKDTLEGLRYWIDGENLIDGCPKITEEALKEEFNKQQWKLCECFENDSERRKSLGYHKKEVVVLQSASRGLKTWDRVGEIHY